MNITQTAYDVLWSMIFMFSGIALCVLYLKAFWPEQYRWYLSIDYSINQLIGLVLVISIIGVLIKAGFYDLVMRKELGR